MTRQRDLCPLCGEDRNHPSQAAYGGHACNRIGASPRREAQYRGPIKGRRDPARALFEAALKRVESDSIRSWAVAGKNAGIFLKIARTGVKNGLSAKRTDDVSHFAAFIVAQAIGL